MASRSRGGPQTPNHTNRAARAEAIAIREADAGRPVGAARPTTDRAAGGTGDRSDVQSTGRTFDHTCPGHRGNDRTGDGHRRGDRGTRRR